MRALRVLGVAEDGAHLVCEDLDHDGRTPETFTLPLDERLRAAVRGDLSRLGQLEIEMESQLRPREIQSRIRAGATVEQVAAAAGCPADRVERYAYPVLMERATVADRAKAVRPMHGAALGSAAAEQSEHTLEEIVTATLADRGQLQDLQWDAFRDERGWTVTATWRAGRSENRADWSYRANADGGVITARNEEAADLVEPGPRQLRTIGGAATPPDERASGPTESGPTESGPTPDEEQAAAVENTVTDDRAGAHPRPDQDAQRQADTGTDGRRSGSGSARSATGPTSRGSRRGHRPPMPSWEDVLLGTRSTGN